MRAQHGVAAWRLAGQHAPDHCVNGDRPLVIDFDGTLVTAHSQQRRLTNAGLPAEDQRATLAVPHHFDQLLELLALGAPTPQDLATPFQTTRHQHIASSPHTPGGPDNR
jgi:hypothetical protein